MTLEQTEQIIDQFVANILANGSDDELFASGYLQGHLDLILKGSQQAQHSFEQFMQRMEQSLSDAYGKNELSQIDRKLVEHCWSELKVKIC
ncbi:YfcL family protein [Psychrobium sp. 1_MG-2023]|uniref:YfcL family protein n=1 Tax=Psychrobium sp. 1_MG-2023 TaxID=3062624 RepID=UPI000C3283F8|nr:YfcL family protein [Psychrobium sp. 1_MG-2023]MDP2560190.1 YfcL family protein [Psychrobium sp. 1_MG-2023]PKF57001.1 hypothetical protein CW748_07855 [Alteromonadales bacterium alter-6D02]